MNILRELYNGNIEEISRRIHPKNDTRTDKELLTYNELKSKLTPELDELFERLMDLIVDRYGFALEDKYIQGFKTGVLIGIECSKLEL